MFAAAWTSPASRSNWLLKLPAEDMSTPLSARRSPMRAPSALIKAFMSASVAAGQWTRKSFPSAFWIAAIRGAASLAACALVVLSSHRFALALKRSASAFAGLTMRRYVCASSCWLGGDSVIDPPSVLDSVVDPGFALLPPPPQPAKSPTARVKAKAREFNLDIGRVIALLGAARQ